MIINPFRTWWKCRKYWKIPKIKLFCGRMYKKEYYSEDSTIKDKQGIPIFKKGDVNYIQKGFIYFVSPNYLKWDKHWWNKFITIDSSDIGWKDKYNTPRYEHNPFFSIIIGTNLYKAFQFALILKCPVKRDENYWIYEDDYWESMLNFVYYNIPLYECLWFNNNHELHSHDGVKLLPIYNPEMFTKLGNELVKLHIKKS